MKPIITEEYPLGGNLEPFDICREKQMLAEIEQQDDEGDLEELGGDDEDIDFEEEE